MGHGVSFILTVVYKGILKDSIEYLVKSYEIGEGCLILSLEEGYDKYIPLLSIEEFDVKETDV